MYRYSLYRFWLVISVVCIGSITCQEDGDMPYNVILDCEIYNGCEIRIVETPTPTYCRVVGSAGWCKENCRCSLGTFSVNGTCYSVNQELSTYADATKHCQREGGHLIKLEPSHNLTKFLENVSSEFSDVWIGLDDEDEEGSFRWIADGSELNWNMSIFRSENDEDLNCIGMDSSGDFQFLDCKTNHAATCDLKVCSDGTCDCYQLFSAKNPIDLYHEERCILSLQKKAPNSFMEQEATCEKIGLLFNNGLNGSLAIYQPWYDIKNIIMKQIQNFPRGQFFWIGLTDLEVEGQVKFRLGHSDLDVLNDTDNDFNAANSDAVDCVSINTKSGQWNYALCSKMLPSICQTEPHCEGTSERTPTAPYTEVTESFSTRTKDLPESHVVMVSMVAGVIGSSLTILAVIVVICVTLKYFKASSKRFRRYKMSSIHGAPYTEVRNGIEPSNSFVNRPPRNHRPLSFAERFSMTTDSNEHFYDDSESNGEMEQGRTRALPSIYNGGDSITYEDLDSPAERHVELNHNTFGERALRTSNRNVINTRIKEIDSDSRSSRIMLLNESSPHEGPVTNATEGVNNCYDEIDSNIYQEVHEMKTADSSYDDVTVEEKEVATPDMTYNEFYDGAGVSDNVTLDMVYNDSYDHGHFEGNTAEDYDEI